MGELLSDSPLFEHRLRFDFQELELDQLMILRHTAKHGQYSAGLVFTAMVHKPPRTVGHEKHADEEDQRWGKLQADGN